MRLGPLPCYATTLLHREGGNIPATARALSIDRRILQRKLRKRPDWP